MIGGRLEIVLTEADLRKYRNLIDKLMDKHDFDGIAQRVPGISIVERNEGAKFQDTCFSYAFRFKKTGARILLRSYQVEGEETYDPEDGDFIFYYKGADWLAHGGIFNGRNRVVSKFNLFSHAYSHPRLLVPTWFGGYHKVF